MINKVTLIGRAGAAPEVKQLQSGVQVARLSLATSRGYKDQNGNWQNETDWHNVILWRDLAERAAKQVNKGVLLYVEAEIRYRKYQDKEGQERYNTDIVAKKFRKLEKSDRVPLMPTEAPQTYIPSEEVEATATQETTAMDDDLPF
jgi:single-strand DNA-binding protein